MRGEKRLCGAVRASLDIGGAPAVELAVKMEEEVANAQCSRKLDSVLLMSLIESLAGHSGNSLRCNEKCAHLDPSSKGTALRPYAETVGSRGRSPCSKAAGRIDGSRGADKAKNLADVDFSGRDPGRDCR